MDRSGTGKAALCLGLAAGTLVFLVIAVGNGKWGPCSTHSGSAISEEVRNPGPTNFVSYARWERLTLFPPGGVCRGYIGGRVVAEATYPGAFVWIAAVLFVLFPIWVPWTRSGLERVRKRPAPRRP